MHVTSTFAGSFAGRFAPLVALLVLSAACRDTTPARAYEVRGIVSELSEDGGSIVLAHEQIADYMPAMTMEFPLGHPDLDDGLEPGDQIRFQIVVDASGRPTILHVEEEKIFSGLFPKFSLRTPGGEIIDSGLLSGKVAVVNFWASWCAPCREEMPLLVDFYADYADQGLVVLGINEDPENEDAIAAQIDEFAINYPVALGDGQLEAALGGVFQIPTTFVLDREGAVVSRHIGLVEEADLRAEIEGLLEP
jgi:thiol-disulfide isomerase/thioredoxin